MRDAAQLARIAVRERRAQSGYMLPRFMQVEANHFLDNGGAARFLEGANSIQGFRVEHGANFCRRWLQRHWLFC